ncbi:MAG: hypothetical protein WAN36_02460 [Calditrichia bacterium]
MTNVKKFVSLLFIAAFSLSLLLSTGCSRHPNDEQIRAMEEARSACLSAEQKLKDLQQQRSQLENDLSQKKAELEELQGEKEKVQQGLDNWQEEE